LAFTLVLPGARATRGKDPNGVEWRSIFLGYAGLSSWAPPTWRWGCFISSLTESQMIAALTTFVVLLMTWIIGWKPPPRRRAPPARWSAT